MRNALAALRRALLRPRPPGAELIRAASRAPQSLGESTALVRGFLRKRQNPDGGFQDRDGRGDLYYCVFGMQSLLAIGEPVSTEPLRSYLAGFGSGSGLDFVSLCSLARCRALLGGTEEAVFREILRNIEYYRAADGGYHPSPGSPHGTAAAAFLAVGAYGDLRRSPPDPARIADALAHLATPEGAWVNERPAQTASTHSTAAAMAALAALGFPVRHRTAARWLLAQAHPAGGFRASPLAPLPDLLSTAVALHAVRSAGLSVAPVREPCLDFIDSLWSNAGGFHGHWHDDIADVEYTFYGLLALGHLAP